MKCSLLLFEKDRHISGFKLRKWILSANIIEFRTGTRKPLNPSITISLQPGISEAIIGFELAKASIRDLGKPSE